MCVCVCVCVCYIELHELFLHIGVKYISFANNFSHSEGCLFLLVRISFAVQILLRLTESHLLFLFNFHYFKWWMKNNLPRFMSKHVLPMFSSRAVYLSFRSHL